MCFDGAAKSLAQSCLYVTVISRLSGALQRDLKL